MSAYTYLGKPNIRTTEHLEGGAVAIETKRRMITTLVWLFLCISLAGPVAAQPTAKSLKNVSGMDASPLIGMVCRGTFEVAGAGRSDNSYGAFKLEFSERDGVLLVNHSSKLGMVAYRAAMDPNIQIESTGDAQSVKVEGRKISILTARSSKWEVELNEDGSLTGTTDPRGMPGRENWNVARVSGKCSGLTAATPAQNSPR